MVKIRKNKNREKKKRKKNKICKNIYYNKKQKLNKKKLRTSKQK